MLCSHKINDVIHYIEDNITLQNVNRLKTITNEKGQRTNDSSHQLALIAPIYLAKWLTDMKLFTDKLLKTA